MDSTQILLIVVIVLLTLTLTIIGIQVLLVLKELRIVMQQFSRVLDGFEGHQKKIDEILDTLSVVSKQFSDRFMAPLTGVASFLGVAKEVMGFFQPRQVEHVQEKEDK